ncbi:M13 family metallopeptidase [Capnocytophaga sputigena]|uniref:Endothelin-converting protein n=1 Tax=Capnocytophaga sputigena TaxID=1019 RepID=A0AAX2IB69_CAPSP|nr:M13 family metallopeptidase [Capnocytophaga sputigena]ATA83760.1 endothelin-converting protein [Capnocytophaga sputigena]EEB66767.1 peptidase family M13 [Capnocytophaga sputigena ATCC 33612]SQA75304.1 Neutral endopeptidase [Capnocytophaga sputigena]
MMRKTVKTALLFSSAALIVACGGNNKKSENAMTDKNADKGLSLAEMDTTVRPQDDFYNYVNGTWAKTAKIPADKPTWGSFHILREKTDENCLLILDNLLKENFAQGTEGQKIKDLYESFIDWKKRDAEGLKPIEGLLTKIDNIKTLADLQKYLEEVTPEGENPICAWGVYADMKDSNMNTVYLGNFSIGMGRDYYQKDNKENTEALQKYQDYVMAIFKVLKDDKAAEKAKQMVDFERSIAKLMLTNEEDRNPNLSYNPQTMAELSKLVKNINLPQLLKNVGVNTDKVVVSEIRLYKQYDKFINEKNLPLIKDYLKYQLVADNASNLTKELDELSFNFYSKELQGQQEQRPMNKRALSVINGILGEAFGKLYVEKYFPPKAKEEMVTLVDYLKKSFAQHIKDVTWMSDATKEKALAKLNKFTVKVGYPDKWEDYSKLTIEPAAKTVYFANLQRVSEWAYQKSLEKVGKPVDKTKWGMSPQTVNAYYNPLYNEIVFPAAILQPPFFNFEADPAVNFGGIGAVIGHEMTHGFDDSGAEFDGDGNLKNWWTPEDKKNFENATKALAKQYDQYEPVKGVFVNGTFTSGENIADLGGVNIAFDALQMYLKDKGNVDKISNFTQDQRFFISWGTVWRTLSTDKYLTNQVKTDPHSPGYFRSFGPLVNVDAWYKAFDVKEGDKLYKKPEDRVKIW